MLFSLILDVNMKEKTSVSTLFMSHFAGGSNNIQLRNVSFCQIEEGFIKITIGKNIFKKGLGPNYNKGREG